ncbi:MAG: hypothetical protein C0609_00435 [Deltaproteobacteria bacterium]|nr:MAG: hypothetical protein C0609_00435 [Deltaproteobacteria bacterium]
MNFIINRLKNMSKEGLLGFILLAVILGVAGFVTIARTVNTSPSQCATCHPDLVPLWASSQGHPSDKVTCYHCHTKDVEVEINLLTYVRDLAIPERYSSDREHIEARCLGCHEGIPTAEAEHKQFIRINHKAHLSKELDYDGSMQMLSCLDCHRTIAHDYSLNPTSRPLMVGCFTGDCHAEDRNPDNCRRCHYQQMDLGEAFADME